MVLRVFNYVAVNVAFELYGTFDCGKLLEPAIGD